MKVLPRGSWLRLLMAVAVLWWRQGRPAWAADRPPPRPNIVIVLVDDLGWGDVSAYGSVDARTPRMDALLAAGVRFDRFYANAPVCAPTRAALLTGRYPDLVGVRGVTEREMCLRPDAVMLPQLLREAGYHTALFGKWHLGETAPNLPNDRGFDTFRGTHYGMLRSYTRHQGDKGRPMGFWDNREPMAYEGHATDLVTDWAVDYIQERAGAGTPFFLYLAYHAPHSPIEPLPEWLERVTASRPELIEGRRKFLALVEHLDEAIGRVTDALDRAKVRENTLVIFASDNGATAYGSNKPLRGGKRFMWEGGIRVPAGIVWPGRIPAGQHTEFVALTMDVLPTICTALELPVPAGLDGINLLPVFRGEPQPAGDRSLFWMRLANDKQTPALMYYAARQGDWKILQNKPTEPFQLYNLQDDPGERRPLAIAEHPAIYERLISALRDHNTRAGAVPWQKERVAEPAASDR